VGAIEDVGGTTAVTVSCIVKIISWGSYAGVVARTNDSDTGSYWIIRKGTDSAFRWMLKTSGGWVYTNNVGYWKGYGEWHHMVGTYDGAYARFYQDGVEIDSMAKTGTIYDTPMKLFFGSYDNGSGGTEGLRYITDGTLADVRIWRRSLSANEVADLYQDPWALYRPARPIRELYRGKAGSGAISTGLSAIEAGAAYGAPGLNSGLHAISTGIAT
jgi:hypothetical protein